MSETNIIERDGYKLRLGDGWWQFSRPGGGGWAYMAREADVTDPEAYFAELVRAAKPRDAEAAQRRAASTSAARSEAQRAAWKKPSRRGWPTETVVLVAENIGGPRTLRAPNADLPGLCRAAGYGVPRRDEEGYYWAGAGGGVRKLVARASSAAPR